MKINRNLILASVLFVLLVMLAVKITVRIRPPQTSAENISVFSPHKESATASESEPVQIMLAGECVDLSVSNLVLGPDVTAVELIEVIPKLSSLSIVEAQQCRFSTDEKRYLITCFPDIHFLWDIQIGASVISSTQSQLTLPEPEQVTEFLSFSDLLPGITEIELCGGDYSAQQVSAIAEAWPQARLSGTIALFGQSFSIDAEELDFSGTKISPQETDVFSSLIYAMPSLKKVIMSDCGICDEDMDALDQSYDSVRFVWTVHFKVYDVRTDTDRFCVSDLPWNDYFAWPMRDTVFAPIKYCRDLVALDLGHENISDLSFLYNMPKLKYLIIASAYNTLDLTPVASLKDLYYLEVFNNKFLDISPLAECKNLKHLNISNTRGDYSIEPLFQMTQLDRLWFALNHLTEKEKEALRTALPNTDIYLEQTNSVGGSWRKSEVYYELRSALFAPGH